MLGELVGKIGVSSLQKYKKIGLDRRDLESSRSSVFGRLVGNTSSGGVVRSDGGWVIVGVPFCGGKCIVWCYPCH